MQISHYWLFVLCCNCWYYTFFPAWVVSKPFQQPFCCIFFSVFVCLHLRSTDCFVNVCFLLHMLMSTLMSASANFVEANLEHSECIQCSRVVSAHLSCTIHNWHIRGNYWVACGMCGKIWHSSPGWLCLPSRKLYNVPGHIWDQGWIYIVSFLICCTGRVKCKFHLTVL